MMTSSVTQSFGAPSNPEREQSLSSTSNSRPVSVPAPVMKTENPTASSQAKNGEEEIDDDGISIVVPEKSQVLSDMRAIVDWQELQMAAAQRKIVELENKLTGETSKSISLQIQVQGLQKSHEELGNKISDLLSKQKLERLAATAKAERKQQEIEMLKNQVGEIRTHTSSILNGAKRKMVEAQTFFSEVNELGKLFDGYYMVTDDVPTTTTTTTTTKIPPPSLSVSVSSSSGSQSNTPTKTGNSMSSQTNVKKRSKTELSADQKIQIVHKIQYYLQRMCKWDKSPKIFSLKHEILEKIQRIFLDSNVLEDSNVIQISNAKRKRNPE